MKLFSMRKKEIVSISCYIIISSLFVYIRYFKVTPKNTLSFIEMQLFTSDEIRTFEEGYRSITDDKFLHFLRQRWIVAPSSLNYTLKENRNGSDYSQIGQSNFVKALLNSKRNGIFVECGAFDGEYLSNTLFFEKELGWSGLLIEANPKLYKELLQKNRKAFMSNVCLNVKNRTDKLEFKAADECGGLNLQNQMRFRGGDRISVQCFPLYSLLLALRINRVDYFSLDVEGPELEILNTIPFDDVYIDVIGVEYRVVDPRMEQLMESTSILGPNRKKLNEIRDFFKSTGLYEEVGILGPETQHLGSVVEREIHGLDVFFKRI